jgi:hypothetical protein
VNPGVWVTWEKAEPTTGVNQPSTASKWMIAKDFLVCELEVLEFILEQDYGRDLSKFVP